MKAMPYLLFALACVLLGGCASPDFTPYVGEQDWPLGAGSTVQTNYVVPIYYGWPNKAYTVLGVITAKGSHPVEVARFAKSKGADALIYRGTLTGNAGTYTTPGHATSITSGSYAYGQYSGFTTTTYNPGVSVPLIVAVTAYNAIKWNEPARFVPLPLSSNGQTNTSEMLDPATLKTLEASAEKGGLFFQVTLASIYDVGFGAQTADSAKAAYWYLRAAKQGDTGSQFIVGVMYEKGEGVMQDFVEAYKWFNIATVAPDIDWNTATNYLNSKEIATLKKSWVSFAEKAKAARDQLVQQMTPDQIAEGQRRSGAFVPREETPSSNSQSALATQLIILHYRLQNMRLWP